MSVEAGILAFDTGANSAWSFFLKSRLYEVGKFNPEEEPWPLPPFPLILVSAAYIEKPSARGGKTKASTDSLITLGIRTGIVFGACIQRSIPAHLVEAVRWKGSMPKSACHEHIRERLEPNERDLLHGASKDVLDAVGLGLWALGRFGRQKISF